MRISPVLFLACVAAAVVVTIGCKKSSDSSPTSPSQVPVTNTGQGIRTYTYAQNIAPILTDCLPCHGPLIQNATYNFSTYAGVLRALTPGSDQSPIVRMTQPNGPMYLNLSGDRFSKAGVIYDWVVNSGAAQ
jgi:hypothetical protein